MEREQITANVDESTLSRTVIGDDDSQLNEDKYEVMSVAPVSTDKAHQLTECTEHDGTMQAYIEVINVWPRNKTNLQQELQEHFDVHDEMSVDDGIVMNGLLT